MRDRIVEQTDTVQDTDKKYGVGRGLNLGRSARQISMV